MQDVVTAEDMVTIEDTVAELSSLLSRPPVISTVMEELHRSCVESAQDAHAQLLAVHEIAADLTVRILDAPTIHFPSKLPDISEPSEEPAPTVPPPPAPAQETTAGAQASVPDVILTREELAEIITEAKQSKDPLVKSIITGVAIGTVAALMKDGIIYIVRFFYYNGC